MLFILATAAGLCVANVYYAQPLLDLLARGFGIAPGAIGMVVGATQLGSVAALVLLVPLGDIRERRRLLLAQLALLCGALLAMACAGSAAVLLLAAAGVGMLGTAMTQGLIACAASLAPPDQRGAAVGAVQGGVVLGLLLSRCLAGLLADAWNWRAVYGVSAALCALLLMALWRVLPAMPAPPGALPYGRLLASVPALLARDRVLRVRGTLALLMFAALNIFWSALVLALSAPPLSYTHTATGMFGLVGALGALGAARAGRLADRGLGQAVSGAALLLLLLSWLPLSRLADSLPLLVLGVIALDLGGQAIHVSNQSLIFRHAAGAHSRLVACYMLFYAAGSALGASAGTAMYAAAGWQGVCALGAAVSLAALLFWAATRPPGATVSA